MAERRLYMTIKDMDRLDHLLIAAAGQATDMEPLENLHNELDKARLVRSESVPPDVVTMNSKVRIRNLATGQESTVTLVFPEDADPTENRISVLDPLGTVILGYRVGDEIRWQGSKTTLHLKIEEILYQPEAAGDLHL